MRLHRFRLELRMELAAQVPRMVGNLADLDVRAVRGLTGDTQSHRFQPILVLAIDLVAMPVALGNIAGTVRSVSEAVLRQVAGPASQPHRSPQLINALQFSKLEDDAMRRAWIASSSSFEN